MIYVGIDPGKDGAVALITENGAITVHDTPTLPTGQGGKRAYDPPSMIELLAWARTGCESMTCLEQVHAMPGQGVTSMFSMGEGYGLWRGILSALRMPHQLVTPQRWKKTLMDGQPKDKAASVLVASRLFPAAAALLRGPKGAPKDGRADALLLAEYARRTMRGPLAAHATAPF